LLPVGFMAGESAEQLLAESPDLVIARVSGARRGVLHERLDYGVIQGLLAVVANGQALEGRRGRLLGTRGAHVWPAELDPGAATRLHAEQRNTSFVFGSSVIAKMFRRLEPGAHPEIALGRHLTERAFHGAPPLLGALEYEDREGQRTALMVVHGFVVNQGTAWDQALHEAGRFLDDASTATAPPVPGSGAVLDRIGWYAGAVRQLGRATAELHHALVTAAVHGHGDYHLGQVLVRDGGFAIVDFEGEATLSLDDRRRAASPRGDLDSMIESFGRAASVALQTWTGHHPEQAEGLRAWSEAWQAVVVEIFRRGYAEAGGA